MKKENKLVILVALLTILSLALSYKFIQLYGFTPFSEKSLSIEVTGNKTVTKEMILKSISSVYSQNEDEKVSTQKLHDEILKNEIIKSAYVKHTLPHKLKIWIKEREIIGTFYSTKTKKTYLVDSSFDLLEQKNFTQTSNLTFYYGEKFEKNLILKLHKILSGYKEISKQISDIEIFYGYRINLILNSKTIVLLSENIEESLKMLSKVITKIQTKPIKAIDFRSSGKIYITYYSKDAKQTYTPEGYISYSLK